MASRCTHPARKTVYSLNRQFSLRSFIGAIGCFQSFLFPHSPDWTLRSVVQFTASERQCSSTVYILHRTHIVRRKNHAYGMMNEHVGRRPFALTSQTGSNAIRQPACKQLSQIRHCTPSHRKHHTSVIRKPESYHLVGAFRFDLFFFVWELFPSYF